MKWRKNKFENNKCAAKYRNELNAYSRKHNENRHDGKSTYLQKLQKEASETKTASQGTPME